MRLPIIAAVSAVAGGAAAASAQFNFDAVTQLARGALQGVHVDDAVDGFEIRLLHRGRSVYHQSFGSWSLDRPSNVDSSSKTMSGALIMSLVERSARPFSLDTRLSDYIPEFDGAKRGITIRQAFSHTSGLPGQSGAEGDRGLTLQQAAVEIAEGPYPNGPAGENFLYGGASMHAAGAVAELAGGASWNTLFQQRIAAPLGLLQTRFLLTTPDNPRIAGGIESTATEFGRLMEALRRGGELNGQRILAQASVDAMFTRQTDEDVTVLGSPIGSGDYGVGVWLDRRDASGALTGALAAGARGFHSWLDYPSEATGVFATELTTYGNVADLSAMIRDAVAASIADPQIPGDADGDGVVDVADLGRLASHWLRANRLWREGDFTGDGFVGVADLGILATHWQDATPFAEAMASFAVVPEPGAGAAIALALGAMSRRRRRA